MSDVSYRLMVYAFNVVDFLYPYNGKRAKTFGIREGMTIVDYGCGPGRYTIPFSRLVGSRGKVYAVDIHEFAIAIVKQKQARYGIWNIEPVLASGYGSGLPDHVADMVMALDMFFAVREPTTFLAELRRIAKPDGRLVIDDGHQSRAATKAKIVAAGGWQIVEERKDHLKYKPA